ncbi:MAG: hypothetical protein PHE84_12780 [bacterium]|nr:hypothetical protein [bacterium]
MKPKRDKDRYAGPLEADVDKMEAQLRLWTAQIDGLADKAKKTGAQAKIEYLQSIDDLKAKRAVAQAKVDEFRAAGSEKWGEFKAGIERAWDDLEGAFINLKP